MAGKYRAILIGNSTYPADEHNLQSLKGPVKDIATLNSALVDGAAGLFDDADVTLLAETSSARAMKALGRFFGAATRDDVLLMYFSGHGKLDQSGRLHLCMQDTETTDLLATAVSSTRINEFVDASRARNVVIILDCCYAGAFRGGDFGDAVAGPGRYVLTSCRGTQLANDATIENATSYFTQHLVEGLLGAATDRDDDGYVDFSDVYTYVDRRLREEGKQIPQRRVIGDGDLRLARRAGSTGTAQRPEPLAVRETGPPSRSVHGQPLALSRRNRINTAVRSHWRLALVAVLAAGTVAGVATVAALHGSPTASPVHDATDLDCNGYDDYLAVKPDHTLVFWPRGKQNSPPGTRFVTPRYPQPADSQFGSQYNSLTLPGDLTGDGKPDLVGVRGDGSLWLMSGDCTGTFDHASARRLADGVGQVIGVGDFNGDRRPDLLGVDSAHRLHLYPGAGNGTLGQPTVIDNDWTSAIPAGDVNADGSPDVLNRHADGSLWLFLSDGKGGWLPDTPAHGRSVGLTLSPDRYPAVIGGVRIYQGPQPDITAINSSGILVAFRATNGWPKTPFTYGCKFGRSWKSTNYRVAANAVPLPGEAALP